MITTTKILKSFLIVGFLTLVSCGESPLVKDEVDGRDEVGGYHQLEDELVLPDSKTIVKGYWRVGPLISDESKMLIVLLDQKGAPVDPPQQLKLMLWMPTMGHGSFPVSVKRVGVGIYEGTEIFFTMGGYWDIHFQLVDQGRVVEEVKWGMTL